MKKKILYIIPVLAGVICAGYLYFNKENVTVTEGTSSNGEKVIQVHDQDNNTASEYPFSMSENSVQQVIHNT